VRAITVVLAILLAIGLAIFLAVSTGDGPVPVEMPVATSDPPAYLAGTTSRLVESAITGRTYQVSVRLPRTYDTSNETYPVLYAVDDFGMVVEIARLLPNEELIPELIIVGIGYPVGHFVDAAGARALELTPSVFKAWEENRAVVLSENPDLPALEGSGGAPEFLSFLRQELIPLIETEYRVDPEDRALYGHSLGGLFAFHALLNNSGTFHKFIVASPSLWWDSGVTFEHEATFAESNHALPARAFFSVGLLEDDVAHEPTGWGLMITNLRKLVDVLEQREYDGFVWDVHFFEDETHGSVIPATISRGLRYIYGEH